MFKRSLLFLLLVLLVFAAILYVRTSRFGTPIPAGKALPVPAASDSAVSHMSQAVQIPTISYADSLPVDTASFTRFRLFLERAYPLVHQKLPRKVFNDFSYLYTWEGKDKGLAPWVLMAHTDVVPVEPGTENKWSVSPFSGTVKDGMVWGRGVADDKSCVVTILEAVEDLLRKGYQPERTIYLSFGHDEEISGARGARIVAQFLKEQNIRPELVLDEGGELTREQFGDIGRPIAAIGVGEKGFLSFRLTVSQPGGHSSMPKKETSIDILSKALVNLRAQQMPYRVTPTMETLFSRVGPEFPFLQRMAFANQWLFGSMIRKQMEQSNVSNAMFHTTLVPTILVSGIKDNVIPTDAVAIVNSRNMAEDPQPDVIAFMKKQIADDRVTITPIASNRDATEVSDLKGVAFRKVEETVQKVMPGVIPVPYLLMGGTDSRNFGIVSSGVIRFAAQLDPKGYHGIDERLPIEDLGRMIFFYSELIQGSGK
jgi:carboxypeptidase PM20D1